MHADELEGFRQSTVGQPEGHDSLVETNEAAAPAIASGPGEAGPGSGIEQGEATQASNGARGEGGRG
ncbi:hypothetical protein ColTof3_01807 [Colletotrichum tofieldiae]|nr:hypothetical protein ColTof3_01807 [Colletotrichum tofieldiae]